MNEKLEKVIKTIIFIVILLIPMIYSFFYLKSYWDPYGNLEDIKIAIVNLDKGNETENQGKEFVQELKDSGTFNICDVTSEEANEGLREGTYYAVITLPEDFTDSLNSAKEEDKRISTIAYTPNKQKNYLATQIINSAIKTIETNLQAKVAQSVVEGLTDSLKDVPESLQQISDGTGKIVTGSQSLNDGLKKIDDGVSVLDDSYGKFDKGIDSAYEGSKTLSNAITQVDTGVASLKNGGATIDSALEQINSGAEKLSDSSSQGLTNLQNGIKSLNTGADNLNTGISSYVDGTENLTEGMNTYIDNVTVLNQNVNQILSGIVAYGNANPEILQNQNFAQLYGGASNILAKDESGKNAIGKVNAYGTQIKAGAQQLNSNNTSLKQGANALKQGASELSNKSSDLNAITNGIKSVQMATAKVKEGTSTLNNGIGSLKEGTNKLNEGSSNLAEGMSTLKTSSSEIQNALNTLNEGTTSAYEGSSELLEGTKTLKSSVDEGIVSTNKELEKLNGLSDFVENPIEFKEDSYGQIDTYGIAFTPLFISIGLWVGSLMCYVVIYYDQKNRFGILGSDAKNKQLQNIIYIGLGAVQGIITGLLLKLGLGFEVENIVAYYFVCLLIGIAFMSIIQFLIRNFGDIGKFMALIILVLQLASSGGTFPVETIDKGFRMWHSILPMTYTIDLLREILVPTDANHQFIYISILVIITICCLGITMIVDFIKNKKTKQTIK